MSEEISVGTDEQRIKSFFAVSDHTKAHKKFWKFHTKPLKWGSWSRLTDKIEAQSTEVTRLTSHSESLWKLERDPGIAILPPSPAQPLIPLKTT